jgi:hypothetical protein
VLKILAPRVDNSLKTESAGANQEISMGTLDASLPATVVILRGTDIVLVQYRFALEVAQTHARRPSAQPAQAAEIDLHSINGPLPYVSSRAAVSPENGEGQRAASGF